VPFGVVAQSTALCVARATIRRLGILYWLIDRAAYIAEFLQTMCSGVAVPDVHHTFYVSHTRA